MGSCHCAEEAEEENDGVGPLNAPLTPRGENQRSSVTALREGRIRGCWGSPLNHRAELRETQNHDGGFALRVTEAHV